MRAELPPAREIAETFLHQADKEAKERESAVARRLLGFACFCQGEFTAAQQHLEGAIQISHPTRDQDAELSFGIDTRFGAKAYLALTSWALGDSGRAVHFIEEAVAYVAGLDHVPTLANAYAYKVMLELLRGDSNAAQTARQLVDLSREHGIPNFLTWGLWSAAWANARFADRKAGLTEFQRVMAERELPLWAPFYQGLLGELEAESELVEGALTRIEDALAFSTRTGARWTDAFLQRIRGEILLKCGSENTAPAEDAFLCAIAIAQQQKAKSFELRAALSLARLYQSVGRSADAHAVLAPALEGFSPTQEFPQIAEAQPLLAAIM